ncbi:hypothetical protein HAX54_050926, partial [Datura stramonium]|nr:hypothetical protein [Datura stramonium]
GESSASLTNLVVPEAEKAGSDLVILTPHIPLAPEGAIRRDPTPPVSPLGLAVVDMGMEIQLLTQTIVLQQHMAGSSDSLRNLRVHEFVSRNPPIFMSSNPKEDV